MDSLNKVKNVKISRYLYLALCAALICYVMWYAGTLPMEKERAVTLYLMLSSIILLFHSIIGKSRLFGIRSALLNKILASILIVLMLISGIYFFMEYFAISYYRMGVGNIYDIILGTIALIIVLECCRKDVEKWIFIIALAFMIYAYIGPWIPVAGLKHKGLSLPDLFRSLSADFPIGIFGTLTQIAFTWISAFVIFAAFLRALGGYDTLFNLMRYMTSKSPYLVPQTGVVTSAIFGMWSGSAPANVVGTGVFTIPMNKRIGVPARFAAAIESVASSGGLIVPPVMGAAAFIMASILGVPYIYICAVAVMPAILYYLSTAISVFCITRRYLDLSKALAFIKETPQVRFRDVLIVGIPFIVALTILVFLMAYFRLDPLIACFYTVIVYIPLAFIYNYFIVFRKSSHSKSFREYVKEFGKRIINAVEDSGSLAATAGVMLATIGVIVGVLTVTGMAVRWSMGLAHAVGYNLPLLVLAVWVIATLLGFGVSATGVYVITIAIALTPFAMLKVPPIIVHFFIFWIAVLSAITPPVAIAAATAAKIAEERFFSVALESMKIGLPLFLICFSFFTWPELLIWSSTTPIAFAILLIATIAMPIGIFGIKALEDALRIRTLYIFTRMLLILLSFILFLARPVLPPYLIYILALVAATISFYAIIRELKIYKQQMEELRAAI